MFDYNHYVPILRWRRAEKAALSYLFEGNKIINGLTPFIEIVPQNPRNKKQYPSKEFLTRATNDILEYWGEEPIFLDTWYYPPGKQMPMETILDEADIRNLSIIPVTGLNESYDDYFNSFLSTFIDNAGKEICLRLLLQDIADSNFHSHLYGLIDYLGSSPARIHLLIDYQFIQKKSPSYMKTLNQVPYLEDWLTVTVSGGCFPQYLTDYKPGYHKLSRKEWKKWKRIITNDSVIRKPSYSDYTIQHPYVIPLPENFSVSASIRYTAKSYTVIMRGESLKKGAKYEQYPAQSQLLCEKKEFMGPDFSYGDQYIWERKLELDEAKIKSPGSPETLLRAGINHHIQLVLSQIDSMRAFSGKGERKLEAHPTL